MDITGKVIQILPKQTGQGKNGTWEKQDYVIETEGRYPKKLCFNLWGDKINSFNLKDGDQIQVKFDLESREYNGRWYTEVRAWDIVKQGAGSPAQEQGPMNGEAISTGADEFFNNEEGSGSDDLPF
ncbi:MAG: DUF3127 domain-containing protein [Bacteroidetes bacterium]|nr:DUF3127 domain-containing protein [Bacteroidota bacterium]